MEQFQQVEISQVRKLKNIHTSLKEVWGSGHYLRKGIHEILQIPEG